MPGLMGNDANQLVRRFGAHQRTNMKEHVAPIDDKGVETAVTYQMNANILLAQARHFEDGAGIDAHKIFDFRIPDQSGGIGRRGRCGEKREREKRRHRTSQHLARLFRSPAIHSGDVVNHHFGENAFFSKINCLYGQREDCRYCSTRETCKHLINELHDLSASRSVPPEINNRPHAPVGIEGPPVADEVTIIELYSDKYMVFA